VFFKSIKVHLLVSELYIIMLFITTELTFQSVRYQLMTIEMLTYQIMNVVSVKRFTGHCAIISTLKYNMKCLTCVLHSYFIHKCYEYQ